MPRPGGISGKLKLSVLILITLFTLEGVHCERDYRGKLVTYNKNGCKCPKGDETEWGMGQFYYCGGQINAAKCDIYAIYSCEGKSPGEEPEMIVKCHEECRINNVSPKGYCEVEYAVPKRAKYSGDPSTLKRDA